MSKNKMTYEGFKKLAENNEILKRKIQKFENLYNADLTSEVGQKAFIKNLENLLKHQKTFNADNSKLDEKSSLKINDELDYLQFLLPISDTERKSISRHLIKNKAFLVIEYLRKNDLMEVTIERLGTALEDKDFPEAKLKDLLEDLLKNPNYKPEDFIKMINNDKPEKPKTIRLAKIMSDENFRKIFDDTTRHQFILLGLEKFSFKNGDMAKIFDKFDNAAFINYRNSKNGNIFHDVIGSDKIDGIVEYVINKVGKEKAKELLKDKDNTDKVTPIDLIKSESTRKFLEEKGLIEKPAEIKKDEVPVKEEKLAKIDREDTSSYLANGFFISIIPIIIISPIMMIVMLNVATTLWVALVGFFAPIIIIALSFAVGGYVVGKFKEVEILAKENESLQTQLKTEKFKVTVLEKDLKVSEDMVMELLQENDKQPSLYPSIDSNAPPPAYDAPSYQGPPSYEQSFGDRNLTNEEVRNSLHVPKPPSYPPPPYNPAPSAPSETVTDPVGEDQHPNNRQRQD